MWNAHLAGDEEVLPPDHALLSLGSDGSTHLRLIAVDPGTVNVPVACVYGRLHGSPHLSRLRLRGSNKYRYLYTALK